MKKWLVALGLTSVAVGLLLWFLARPVAEQIVSTRIESRAAAAGMDVQWGSVEVNGLGLSVPDIRVKRGPTHLQIDRLDVETNLEVFNHETIKKAVYASNECCLQDQLSGGPACEIHFNISAFFCSNSCSVIFPSL